MESHLENVSKKLDALIAPKEEIKGEECLKF